MDVSNEENVGSWSHCDCSPADVPGKAAHGPSPLTPAPMWEAKMKLLFPDFDLSQSWLL